MLQRQTISLPLAQGVDTKTDAKQVVAGKLLALENGIFTTLNAIRKRNGHQQLSNEIVGEPEAAPEITSGKAISTYNNELVLANGEQLFGYDPSLEQWSTKGALYSPQVTQAPVQHDTLEQFTPDGVTHSSGVQVYVWGAYDALSVRRVFYKIIDSSSNQVIVAATEIPTGATGGSKPRVIDVGNKIIVYYVDLTTHAIKAGAINPFDPTATVVWHNITTPGVSANASTVNGTYPCFDVCVSGQRIYLAFNNRTTPAGQTTVWAFNATSPTGFYDPYVASHYFATQALPVTVFEHTSLATPTEGGVIVAQGSTSPDTLTIHAYDYDLVPQATITSALARRMWTISGCSLGGSTAGYNVYWSSATTGSTLFNSYSILLGQARISPFNVLLDANEYWQQSVSLIGQPFAQNQKVFVPVLFQAPAQNTVFVLDENGRPAAKALYESAGNFLGLGDSVSRTTTVSDGVFRFVAQEAEEYSSDFPGAAIRMGLTSITLDLDDPQHDLKDILLANTLHYTGGIVQMYDSLAPVEHGFSVYPQLISTTKGYVDGEIVTGTYQYTACYEWTDANNVIHRSRPSDAVEVVFETGVTTGTVTLDVSRLYLTNKMAAIVQPMPRSNVQIVVYRTLANGSVFYQASDPATPAYNTLSNVPTISITDAISDSDLMKRPLLYSQFLAPETGQAYELENDPAPPARLIQLHRNRLWVVDSTHPLHLWYSKEVQIGGPVEFNNSLVKQIDARGGPITALASLDDKLLVFKQSHIFFIVGQGPTNTNENNDLSDAILVTTDCGCIDPRSIVATPFGVFFKSRKGIYLINRSLSVEYIGAPVEAYNQEEITSALLAADTNNVRFTLANGKTLVFDYYVQQWGVFTNQNAQDTTIWLERSVILRPNGRVWVETPNLFTDAGAPIKLKLATSWLSFANVQGFQRVRRMQILGSWKSAHSLKVSVCDNFNDSIIQEVVVYPQAPSVYGEATPYGEDIYGGSFQLYQWRIDLARQKTQAVKFIIEDISAASAGEGLSLTSLAFEVGAKVGLAKMPPGQIYG